MREWILFTVVFGILFFYNFEHRATASCEEFALNYGASSVCSKPSKKTEVTKSKEKTEQTVLRLFDMRNSFNEGDPTVFVGKLTTKSGTPIPNSKITITHDGVCPTKIIGEGKTDKTGRFWIFANAKIWDKEDNLVKTHAEYKGEGRFLSSTSEYKIIVVLPVQNRNCLD